jgi:hypothetical protein
MELRKLRSFNELVEKVERIKREKWEEFRDRHGDWGRDLVLWAGRRYSGLTLAELGTKVGGVHYTTVLLAIKRLGVRSRSVRDLRRAMRRLDKECNLSRKD